jgi:hypothetical protein
MNNYKMYLNPSRKLAVVRFSFSHSVPFTQNSMRNLESSVLPYRNINNWHNVLKYPNNYHSSVVCYIALRSKFYTKNSVLKYFFAHLSDTEFRPYTKQWHIFGAEDKHNAEPIARSNSSAHSGLIYVNLISKCFFANTQVTAVDRLAMRR